jgi:hypothetical protein
MPMPLPGTTRTDVRTGVGQGDGGGPDRWEVSAGRLSAYVLIQTEVGKAGQVAQAIRGIDGVHRAEDVAGPYDVIARVQAPRHGRARQIGVRSYPGLDGVSRTLTWTTMTCTTIRW